MRPTGQRVVHPHRHRHGQLPGDQPVALQDAQRLGQHLLTDPGDLPGQFRVPLAAAGQRDQDQGNPLVADPVEQGAARAGGQECVVRLLGLGAAIRRRSWSSSSSLRHPYALLGAYFPLESARRIVKTQARPPLAKESTPCAPSPPPVTTICTSSKRPSPNLDPAKSGSPSPPPGSTRSTSRCAAASSTGWGGSAGPTGPASAGISPGRSTPSGPGVDGPAVGTPVAAMLDNFDVPLGAYAEFAISPAAGVAVLPGWGRPDRRRHRSDQRADR